MRIKYTVVFTIEDENLPEHETKDLLYWLNEALSGGMEVARRGLDRVLVQESSGVEYIDEQ